MALFKYNLNNGRYVPYTNGIEPSWDNENHLIREYEQKVRDAEEAARFNFDDLPFANGEEEDCPF